MPNPLFSSYRAGENRVTSSTLAVFERIDLSLVREILAVASGAGSELSVVTFENQVARGASVPDARITARFTWWFETKTERGAYAHEGHGRSQLRQHAKLLDSAHEAYLFVLTPDLAQPVWFRQLEGVSDSARPRILWLGFQQLAEAIVSVASDAARLVGEQTRFLLSELVGLYEADGLLSADDTVIVAARSAWPEFQRIGAYVCQPGRAFREGLSHFGFYADGVIQPRVPRIRRHETHVTFTEQEAARRQARGDGELADLILMLLNNGSRTEGETYDVVFLSPVDDPETVILPHPIQNDMVTASGRPWAWTLGQRYTRLSQLTSGAAVTSAL